MPIAIGISGATTTAVRASNGGGSTTHGELVTKITANSTKTALANHLICWCSAPTDRRNRMTSAATPATATTRATISPTH